MNDSFLEKLKSMNNADWLLICGEMTPQELRTVNAVVKYIIGQFEK